MTKVGNFRGSNYFFSSTSYNSLVQINATLNQLDVNLSSIETQDEFNYLTTLFRDNSELTQSGPYIFGLYQNTNSSAYSEPAGVGNGEPLDITNGSILGLLARHCQVKYL